jgi:hypothetical protein
MAADLSAEGGPWVARPEIQALDAEARTILDWDWTAPADFVERALWSHKRARRIEHLSAVRAHCLNIKIHNDWLAGRRWFDPKLSPQERRGLELISRELLRRNERTLVAAGEPEIKTEPAEDD